MNKNRQGFTLAETILTIGIIGVIAAMVIPLVATSIKKHIIEAQLVSTYSRLDKALEISQMENGGIEEWSDFTHASLKDPEHLKAVFKRYISPYIGGDLINTLRNAGYSSAIKLPDGSDYIPLDYDAYLLRLLSGQIVYLAANGVAYTSGSTKYPIRYAYTFVIDVNGPAKPNIVGKDVFKFAIYRGTKSLLMLGEIEFDTSIVKTLNDVKKYAQSEEILPYVKQSREQMMSRCKRYADWCGALIKQNGWRFPKDYPWM